MVVAWSLPLCGAETSPNSADSANAPQPAASEQPGVPAYTTIERLPDAVTLARLSNGLTVIVQENHVAPVATVRCYVNNTGSAFEGEYLGAGLSHVLEHVVSGGTTGERTEKEIEKIIDTFGGATNAYTSTHLTAYYIDCPARNVKTAVELLAGSMQDIAFEPSEFERELRVVRRELADGETDRRRVLWKMLNRTAYTTHPIRHPVIGYLEVLNQVSNDTIIDFYRERYVPNNQVFVVVGDVETQAILDEVARQWQGTPRGEETLVVMPQEPEQLSPRRAYREMDGKTFDMVFAWPTVELSHDDLYALDVAAYILAEGDSSRMVRRLKYDEQLLLSVSSASYTPHFARGVFAIIASATAENQARAAEEILSEVYRLREELVDPAELAKAKKQKEAELVFGQQTVQQAAESLGRSYLSTGDPLFDRRYAENIQKVTAEEIRDVARRYFVPKRLTRVTIAPPGSAAGPEEEKSRGAESATKLVRLENGVRVLLKRHTHLPLVNIQAFVLGGNLVDTEATAGRSALVAAMLDKGTGDLSAEKIAEFFDSRGGKLSFESGRNTVFGSATTLKADFVEAADLMGRCFLKPSFPAEEFQKVKQLALGAIARRSDNPHQEIMEVFFGALPETTPYHLLVGGTEESVSGLTVDDLQAYHAEYFNPANMVVTVFGDIDPDRALDIVEQHFGALRPKPEAEPIGFDRSNAVAQSIERHKQTGKPTGMVLLGYPAVSIRQQEDYAALLLLDAITSGYGYPGGWLHNELRGEGLVYFVHAFMITGPAPGYFAVLAQTQPEKIDEVVGRIEKNVERAKNGQITQEEFERAVQMVIAAHAQENTTIAAQARQAALDELYGLGYAYDATFEERIRAVKRDDVVRAAQKYLGKHVLATASPLPAGNDKAAGDEAASGR
jgi:zinc protease